MSTDDNKNMVLVRPTINPDRQARQLLTLGMIRNRLLFIHSMNCKVDGLHLAEAIDDEISQAFRQNNKRIIDYRPNCILILSLCEMTLYADYKRCDYCRMVLPSTYIRAEEDSHKQIREICISGISSKRYIFLYGRFAHVRRCVHPLGKAILRGSYDGIRFNGDVPLGLSVISANLLINYPEYSRSTRLEEIEG